MRRDVVYLPVHRGWLLTGVAQRPFVGVLVRDHRAKDGHEADSGC